MKSVETEGKTIEEAIRKACEELKVSREDLEVEVLANGSSGFLGLVGAKNAKIRATLKERPPASYPRGPSFFRPPGQPGSRDRQENPFRTFCDSWKSKPASN